MSDLLDADTVADTTALRAAFRDGALTPLDALDATLARIDDVDPVINAIAAVDVDGARVAAQEATARWAAGTPRSPLDGVPVTVKDSIDAVGLPWRHGSAGHDGRPDATVDAPPAARLREAGAVIVGKTTMPDFGMMAAGVSTQWGVTRNPWDLACSPGGSSSGAGASLAAGIAWGSVGSDIAGSVRLPAAQCGVVALKPTQGRVPHLPSSTVRSAGPMARTVAEVRELFTVISGPDARDELSLPPRAPVEPVGPTVPDGLRVGLLLDLGDGRVADPRVLDVVRQAAGVLTADGVDVGDVAAPFDADPYPDLDRVFQVRARAEWEALPDDRRARVLPELVAWSAGADALSATDLERAGRAVAVARDRMARAVAPFDLVLAPVLPVVSFPADAVGLDPRVPLAHCGFTCWFNQTGQPAAAVPFGLVDGMPVGVQVIGPRFGDDRVLDLAGYLEARRPTLPSRPPLRPSRGAP